MPRKRNEAGNLAVVHDQLLKDLTQFVQGAQTRNAKDGTVRAYVQELRKIMEKYVQSR
jgi:hypothetical protein